VWGSFVLLVAEDSAPVSEIFRYFWDLGIFCELVCFF
jgi:hypothetical protein